MDYLKENGVYHSQIRQSKHDGEFRYRQMHIPTGSIQNLVLWIGHTSGDIDTMSQGLRLLDKWNGMLPRDYRYSPIRFSLE